MLKIRRFRSEDAQEVAAVVAQTLRISNRADYSQAYLEASIQRMNPAFFIEKAKQTHFYLVCEGDKIVGTGAIGPYWGSETEFSFFDIFVLPAYQKRGITFVRDGGDGLGVSRRAKEVAPEYGIDYKTTVFARKKEGY